MNHEINLLKLELNSSPKALHLFITNFKKQNKVSPLTALHRSFKTAEWAFHRALS